MMATQMAMKNKREKRVEADAEPRRGEFPDARLRGSDEGGDAEDIVAPSPSLVIRVARVAFIGLLLLAGGAIMIRMLQNWVIFPATRAIYRTPADFGWVYEDVMLDVGKERTHGWFIPLEDARGVVLFSHGNAGNIADRLESVQLLRGLGFSVMAYDYGGYGRSTGRVSEERCYADIRAVWQHLTCDRGFAPEQILLFGRSLGGAVTTDLAREVAPAAVVLESTFLSVPDMARELFPFLPTRWIVSVQFANKDKIAAIRAPLLIIHSPDDHVIPYRHGKELFARASEPKRFLEIRGDHNEGFVLSMEVYLRGWEEFLAPILPRTPGA